jgi:hypothetical protein
MTIALSILAIYVFILLGYIAKKIFKDELGERGMVIISVYFLHPIFSFWGLSTKPMNLELLKVPMYYLLFSCLTIALGYIAARLFFEDKKDRSIMTVASAINNTGNLGIPLGIALFGADSVIYTSMMSVANTLMTYTLGVFFYSAGNSSLKEAFLNIFKLPVIWAAMLAMTLNFSGVLIHPIIFKSLEMGAYCMVVLQLIIFGMYLCSMKLGELNLKLLLHVHLLKFVFMPIVTIWLLFFVLPLTPFVASVLFLELIVPLAVTNVNIAALYDCKPIDVASLILFTSLLFIPFLLLISYFLAALGIAHIG